MKTPNLYNRVDRHITRNKMNQEEFAQILGVTRTHLNGVMTGGRNLSPKLAKKIAKELKCRVSDLFSDVEEPSAYIKFDNKPSEFGMDVLYVQIPFLTAEASMGGGSCVTSKDVKSFLSFRKDWLISKGNPQTMAVIRAFGESMGETIPDGAVVLIDEGQQTMINNGIYFVCFNKDIFIKRVVIRDKKYYLKSDANGHETEVTKADYFEIIGRCLWFGKELA